MDYQGLLWKINKSGFEERITPEGSRQAESGQKIKWRNKWKALMKVSLRYLGAELRIYSTWEKIYSPLSVKYVDLVKSTVRLNIKSPVGRWSCFSYLSDVIFLSSLPGELSYLFFKNLHETLRDPPAPQWSWFMTNMWSSCNIYLKRIYHTLLPLFKLKDSDLNIWTGFYSSCIICWLLNTLHIMNE